MGEGRAAGGRAMAGPNGTERKRQKKREGKGHREWEANQANPGQASPGLLAHPRTRGEARRGASPLPCSSLPLSSLSPSPLSLLLPSPPPRAGPGWRYAAAATTTTAASCRRHHHAKPRRRPPVGHRLARRSDGCALRCAPSARVRRQWWCLLVLLCVGGALAALAASVGPSGLLQPRFRLGSGQPPAQQRRVQHVTPAQPATPHRLEASRPEASQPTHLAYCTTLRTGLGQAGPLTQCGLAVRTDDAAICMQCGPPGRPAPPRFSSTTAQETPGAA